MLIHADIKIQGHILRIMFIQNVFRFSGLLTYIDIKYEYMVNLLHVSVLFGHRQGSIRQTKNILMASYIIHCKNTVQIQILK